MTTNATLVHMLQVSSWQLEQAVSGFDTDQWFHVPAEGIASAAWIVGHATLIDSQVLEELDLPPLPAMPEDWPALFQTRPEDGTAHDADVYVNGGADAMSEKMSCCDFCYRLGRQGCAEGAARCAGCAQWSRRACQAPP